MSEYRRVNYDPNRKRNPLNEVCYVMYPKRQIVFTGLHDGYDGGRKSTINAAEDIVRAIAVKENIDPRQYVFYDLETPAGYHGHRQGDYRINRLTIEWDGTVIGHVSWREGHCGGKVLADFDGYIRGEDPDAPLRNLAEAYGAISRSDKYTGTCVQDLIDLAVLVNHRYALEDQPFFESIHDKIAVLAKRACEWNETDPDEFPSMPRNAELDDAGSDMFCRLCDWVVSQKPELREDITPVIFIV